MPHNEQTCTNTKCQFTHWLRLEKRIRDALAEYRNASAVAIDENNDWSNATRALEKISFAIGEETGRGYPLD